MSDAYDPTSIQTMTGPGVRWTDNVEPIIWATTLEKLDEMMRNNPTMMRYL